MARLPLEPAYARALLAAGPLGCASEASAVVAMLSVDTVFLPPRSRSSPSQAAPAAEGDAASADLRSARRLFSCAEGDAPTLLAVFRAYCRSGATDKARATWCREHAASARSLRRAADIDLQLREHALGVGLSFEGPPGGCGSGEDTTALRRSLTCGFFQHAAKKQPDGSTYRVMCGGQVVRLHPSSVLAAARPMPECIIFKELVKTTRLYARDATVVDPAWLPELAPRAFKTVSLS